MDPKCFPKLLHHHTVGIVCQQSRKWDHILYIQAFMSLHNKDLAEKGNNLIMQRRELVSNPLPDSKTQVKRKMRR